MLCLRETKVASAFLKKKQNFHHTIMKKTALIWLFVVGWALPTNKQITKKNTMTTYISLNDTTTSSSVVNASDVTTATTVNVTVTWEGGCGEDGSGCNVTGGSQVVNLALCTRLAPPPVPPWLRESPTRLHALTSHCKSWTLYHELCNSGSGNVTLDYPRHGETSDDEVTEAPQGIQWVIPSMALVVLVLLLVLALVLYKYYSRPNKKRMYRVGGTGYRFKPPHTTTSSWQGGRGALVESETAESYLSQPPTGAGPDFRYTRSPVCRLLEQTQYVATPTEDEHRPRPTGPPAFTSPAYFLPALSWLRLPLLRQAWPGESNGTAGEATSYSAARPEQSGWGETTHHWPSQGEGQWAESRTEEEPEYSEIWDPQYSGLNHQGPPPHSSTNGIGPYEYEMQETANGRPVCDCERLRHYQPHYHRPRGVGSPFVRNEHRYEKLWQCREGGEPDLCPSTPGTCENGWLARYRLPSPSVLASDTAPHPQHHHPVGGVHADRRTSDMELLPCDCSLREPVTLVPSELDFSGHAGHEAGGGGRTEVKYINPVYEGRGDEAGPHPGSPLLTRLWGYMGWHRR